MQNNSNIILATVLSAMVLLAWTWIYELPKAQKKIGAKEQSNILNGKTESKSIESPLESYAIDEARIDRVAIGDNSNEFAILDQERKDVIKNSSQNRIRIVSDSLHGSINLRGASFDDLTLAKYYQTTKRKEEVVLFSPAKTKERYFADFGWLSSKKDIELPSPSTLWQSNRDQLTPESGVTLYWINKDNIEFFIRITLDENYMFEVKQMVRNGSKSDISIASYGRINRLLEGLGQGMFILHEGAIGVFNDILQELTYKDLVEEGSSNFEAKDGGWLGITDKYWLSSIIPDNKISYNASFSHDKKNQKNIFNAEFVGQEYLLKSGASLEFKHQLFAGAKKVDLLDAYSENYNIKLFDRAVDFGWFYFLTKPFFFILQFLNNFLGNFGLAILAMTVLVKLAMFPMANKSYIAIGRIKKLQPKIEKIRQEHKENRMLLNQEMMALYKREKVNPVSGCLPALLQIPIFFALYKVLFVTIDMRQAPFYGWIKDLSAPDPTSIFNLFGLLPFEVSGFFTLGALPLMMGATMIIQQKLNPQTLDPTQAKVLKWMPYIFTIVLAAFPAGLVIYWTWSNILSIIQQWVITRKFN